MCRRDLATRRFFPSEVVHPKSMPKRAKPQDEGLDLITVSYNLPRDLVDMLRDLARKRP